MESSSRPFKCSTSIGEIVGPPITGAIYSATNSWHCVIAFSGTVQVVGAITLLYGALNMLRVTKPRLTTVLCPFSEVQERTIGV